MLYFSSYLILSFYVYNFYKYLYLFALLLYEISYAYQTLISRSPPRNSESGISERLRLDHENDYPTRTRALWPAREKIAPQQARLTQEERDEAEVISILEQIQLTIQDPMWVSNLDQTNHSLQIH
ncbi:hypothetical protein GQ53DRAFT_764457 [Thozetella sp. PMI_491]|nr:hypothetical protein GQ53DRAFT_764457 [Thozetella sp. PMI_491]